MSLAQRPASQERTRAFPRSVTYPLLITLALLAMGLAGLATLAQASDVTARGYRLRELEQQRDQLQAQVHQLEVETASLASLESLQREAQRRFSMGPPSQTVFLPVQSAPQPSYVPSRFLPDVTIESPPQRPWWQILLQLIPRP